VAESHSDLEKKTEAELAECVRQALAYHRAGRLAEAYARYRQLLSAHPAHPDLLNLAGAAALQMGDPAAARQYLEDAIAARPDFPDARANLAALLQAKGAYDEARRHLQRCLELKPDHLAAWRNLGNNLRLSGRPMEACEAYRRALELAPADHDTRCYLGDALHAAGEVEAAIETYRAVLAETPDHNRALGHLAGALQQLGRLEEALTFARQAVARQPSDPLFQYNLGCVLQSAGRPEEACGCYEVALKLDPAYAKAWFNLGMMRQALGDDAAAAAAYRRLLEVAPDHPSGAHMLDAVEGRTTAIAPARHIREIFDRYAEGFEEHLVGKLGYSAPEALRALLDAHLQRGGKVGDDKPFRRALDMGCGTGLVARQVQDLAQAIDGLDIAPRMAAAARRSGLYNEVFEEDVAFFLTEGGGRERDYDLVLSADVFIYIGDLAPIFAALGVRIPEGGLFAFSVEDLDEGDFKLLPTGRYAQSGAYIDRLAAETGFEVVSRRDFTLRQEWNRPIAGRAYLLERS
jgi:predicted TPR repeat methyltransferase